MHRRDALQLGAALAASLLVPGAGRATDEINPALNPAVPTPTLRDVCRSLGIVHGAARDHVILPDDALLDRLMARECDVVTPENGGKWAVFQPEDGVFDWARFDSAVEQARSIGARPNWHCAIWQHMGMPDYMKLPSAMQGRLKIGESAYFSDHGTLDTSNQWDRFTRMTQAVRERYGDVFYRIDVANEVFFWETPESHADKQDEHGFRKGMWWVAGDGARLGQEWLDPYFHHMRSLFPRARLVLNEFGIELAEGWQQRKRAYLLAWLQGAVARKVPVDGLGLQSHLIAGKPYDSRGMRDFLRTVTRLGVPVHITEFDADETRLPQRFGRSAIDRTLAQLVNRYLADVASHGHLVELCWWHLRSDLNYISRQYPGADFRPSPYDRDGQPQPLYSAAVQALFEGGGRDG